MCSTRICLAPWESGLRVRERPQQVVYFRAVEKTGEMELGLEEWRLVKDLQSARPPAALAALVCRFPGSAFWTWWLEHTRSWVETFSCHLLEMGLNGEVGHHMCSAAELGVRL